MDKEKLKKEIDEFIDTYKLDYPEIAKFLMAMQGIISLVESLKEDEE